MRRQPPLWILFGMVCCLTVLLTIPQRAPAAAVQSSSSRPNIVVILADDLGIGDVRCYNSQGKIATPVLDTLAATGMRFTDAHSASAVCTPTRYGLLTGRYCWRTRLQSGVLGGLSPRLIEPGRLTLASLLKKAGYATACVGKWHLGMDWQLKPGKQVSQLSIESREQVFNVVYDQPIRNGPNSVGFDYFFGISGSLDMVPYAFIENDRVTANPTEDRDFPFRADRPKPRCRKGPTAPGFEASDVLPTLTRKAVEWIDQRAADRSTPFFLYLPLASPHTPILPTTEWTGKSGLGVYGDFVQQTDHAVGQVLAALQRHGLSDNTLVVFTSDNGCSPLADYPDLLKKGHNPSWIYRGTKADLFEGGHRVPFLVRWPAQVKPGTTSSQLVCLNDLFRTCAEIVGSKLPDNAGEDSYSLLSILRGEKSTSTRQAIVHHSVNGSFAIREGKWKLCLCPDSGGWSEPRPGKGKKGLPPVQLYDLESDIGETSNRQAEHPETVKRLQKLLESYVEQGRSTPGTRQANAVEVRLFKTGK
jgi:arylsulfatase A